MENRMIIPASVEEITVMESNNCMAIISMGDYHECK